MSALPLTRAERIAFGKGLRKQIPRSRQAVFEPATDRADPVAVLEAQARSRVAELVPIRYGRMLVSPFTFYRGAAAVMAGDLATTPTTQLRVQCCGDAHLSNFGVFASPDRRLVFDINDFDETLPGPWEWDVKRLATSMLIAARDNGLSAADQDRIVRTTVARYRHAMRAFAGQGMLEVWYARLEIERLLGERADELTPVARRNVTKQLAKARTRDHVSARAKLTEQVDGAPRIVDDSPLIVPLDRLVPEAEQAALAGELRAAVAGFLSSVRPDRRHLLEQFEPVDFARKVVGVGSVGTRAWIALLAGRDHGEPLVMQLKEAEPSVLEAHLEPSAFAHHGMRVVAGQRLMQASSDILLGWLSMDTPGDRGPRDFYGRQLKDWKGSAEIEQMRAAGLVVYGELCGWTLARAHARSGDRIAIAAYLGRSDVFDRALVSFARDYAEQNQRDYARLAAAVDTGEVTARAGV